MRLSGGKHSRWRETPRQRSGGKGMPNVFEEHRASPPGLELARQRWWTFTFDPESGQKPPSCSEQRQEVHGLLVLTDSWELEWVKGRNRETSEEASIVTQEEKTVEVWTAAEWVWSETQQPPLTTRRGMEGRGESREWPHLCPYTQSLFLGCFHSYLSKPLCSEKEGIHFISTQAFNNRGENYCT